MPQPWPKVGVLLACLWQMYKLQIHKFVSRCDHLNVSTMYSIFDWKEFEILSYRQAFLESTEISASEEPNALKKAPVKFLPLRKLSRKVPVQFMPLRKLSGKFHLLLQFYTNSWKHTYVSLRLRVQNQRTKWNFLLNFHTMRKLSELYSEIFQTQSSGWVSGLDHFRNFTNLKILNI